MFFSDVYEAEKRHVTVQTALLYIFAQNYRLILSIPRS